MEAEAVVTSTNTGTHHHPFFYFRNTTQSQTSNFFLHSHPSSSTTLYNNYGTTLTIIILLHVVYFLQWNGRRSRRELCTSYEQLVEKKLFFKAAIAIASHPPVDGGERNAISVDDNIDLYRATIDNGGSGGGTWVSVATIMSRRCSVIRRMSAIFQRIFVFGSLVYQRILYPVVNGSLSGLPLLAFTSHILWQCRALEELYDAHDGKLILGVSKDANLSQFAQFSAVATEVINVEDVSSIEQPFFDEGYTYFRVIVALAFTSILIELMLFRLTMRRNNEFSSRRHRRERAICSTASLSTAILGVYNSRFPYAPPPVLPFVRASFLSASEFNYLFSILILTLLTRRIHLVTSVFSGLLSGSLWSMGFTSFIGTRYWGNAVLFGLMMAILLSLKSRPFYSKYLEKVFPCIDYVAWDGLESADDEHGEEYNYDDIEMGSRNRTQMEERRSQERFPLLLSQSSTVSDDERSSSAIRGRVPLINSMESDIDGTDDLIRHDEESMPSASPRFGTSVLRSRP